MGQPLALSPARYWVYWLANVPDARTPVLAATTDAEGEHAFIAELAFWVRSASCSWVPDQYREMLP